MGRGAVRPVPAGNSSNNQFLLLESSCTDDHGVFFFRSYLVQHVGRSVIPISEVSDAWTVIKNPELSCIASRHHQKGTI